MHITFPLKHKHDVHPSSILQVEPSCFTPPSFVRQLNGSEINDIAPASVEKKQIFDKSYLTKY